ncbi:MAG: hypothetical protein QM628_15860 [Propionicimonas sp.]
MTETTAFTPNEYLTLQVDRELEPLYKDTYRNFGWTVEGYGAGMPKPATVTIKLKRDRRLPNRQAVLEQQRIAEHALATIAGLEQSKQTAPMMAALTAGIVGSIFLAGSVFAITANLWLLGIPLGIVGLVGWVAGYFAHGRVKASRAVKVSPLLDREYETVYAAGEQASRLMAA